MEKWVGKVALVTGANSGIGLAVTVHLLNRGMQVVGFDKEINNLENLSKNSNLSGLHHVKVDLCIESDVLRAFQWVENNMKGIDVLVNNAGVGGILSLLDGNTNEWRKLLEVNVIAFSLSAVKAIELMRKVNVKQGQIINITSNLAHYVPSYAPFHFYSATKHAAQALTEGLRLELIEKCLPIRVTSICPGLVKTEIFKSSLGENMDKNIYSNFPSVEPKDIASAIEYILSTPMGVSINDITITPTGSKNS